MKEIKCLIDKFSKDKFERISTLHTKWMKKFCEFILKHIKEDRIKGRIEYVHDNIVEYVVEVGTTLPRTRDGRDFSCPMPNLQGVFIVQDITTKLEEDGKTYAKISPAIAVLYNKLERPDTFIHEMAHAFSSTMKYLVEEGQIYKNGVEYSVRDCETFKKKSGDWINEGLTEALAGIFFDENIEELKKDFDLSPSFSTKKPEYHASYDSYIPMKIMLRDMSNELLVNAYFGDKEDLQKFAEHFNEVMKDEQIDFKEFNKYDNQDEGAHPHELLYLACKYVLNMCTTQEEKDKEIERMKGLLTYNWTPSFEQALLGGVTV